MDSLEKCNIKLMFDSILIYIRNCTLFVIDFILYRSLYWISSRVSLTTILIIYFTNFWLSCDEVYHVAMICYSLYTYIHYIYRQKKSQKIKSLDRRPVLPANIKKHMKRFIHSKFFNSLILS